MWSMTLFFRVDRLYVDTVGGQSPVVVAVRLEATRRYP
jgi:hypothetical protein